MGGVTVGAVLLLVRRSGRKAPTQVVATDLVTERVRAVGKLVGLEVHAKEIATMTRGWGWLPPIVMSQAKIAMIFAFDKQYFIDLNRLRPEDVVQEAEDCFLIRLPDVEGTLRLADVKPYDIQAGRIMGLVDVIPMTAQTQADLMESAREQAAELFQRSEQRYAEEARRSVERQLRQLLELFDARVRVEWPRPTDERDISGDRMELDEQVKRQFAGV